MTLELALDRLRRRRRRTPARRRRCSARCAFYAPERSPATCSRPSSPTRRRSTPRSARCGATRWSRRRQAPSRSTAWCSGRSEAGCPSEQQASIRRARGPECSTSGSRGDPDGCADLARVPRGCSTMPFTPPISREPRSGAAVDPSRICSTSWESISQSMHDLPRAREQLAASGLEAEGGGLRPRPPRGRQHPDQPRHRRP